MVEQERAQIITPMERVIEEERCNVLYTSRKQTYQRLFKLQKEETAGMGIEEGATKEFLGR